MNSEPMLPARTSPVATPIRMSHCIGIERTSSSSGSSLRRVATASIMSTAARQARLACSPASTKGGPQ